MLKQLILQQMDYIFFVYGLAFILLGVICFATYYRKSTSFPLKWLGLFGFSHGINEWLDMLVISQGDGIMFSALRLLMMGVSFVFLLEFGRAGLQAVTGRTVGRWIYLPLLAAVWLSRSGSFTGLNVMMRYCFGLVGGLLSALAFYRASRGKGAVGHIRKFEAVMMTLYALAAGAIVPKASFFPASLINHESFLSLTGIPVQLVRGLLAALLAAGIWMHYQKLKNRRIIFKRFKETVPLYGVHLTLLMVAVLSLGWAFSENVGRSVDRDNRNNLLVLVRVAAAGINPERVLNLQGTSKDLQSSDFQILYSRLMVVQQVDPHIREIALLVQRDGQVRDILDAAPARNGQNMIPTVDHEQARRGFEALFASGGSLIVGPYRDSTGTYITSYAAVVNPANGKVVAVVGCDVRAEDFQRMVANSRLLPISITLLVCLLFISFFVVRQRMWDSRQQIVDSEKDLSEAQRIAHVGSWNYDIRSGTYEWSEEMLRICGLDPERSHHSPTDCIARDIDGFFCSGVRELAEKGGQQEFETCLVLPDGSSRDIAVTAEAVTGEDGTVFRVTGTTQDITERIVAWEQVILARDKAEQYFQLTPSAIFTVDTDKAVTSWNNAMIRATGYSTEEALGRNCAFFAETPCNEKCGLYAADVPKPVIRRECTIRHKDGTTRHILKNVDVLVDEQGKVIGGIESFEDVTDRIQAEQRVLEVNRQLEAARRVAETASATKSEFLANMSHEIRTPMNAVIGITQLVLKTELTQQQREYLRKVMFAADSLMGIINDLLDFSKIEAGRMELESTNFLLEDVLDQVIDLVAEKAHEKRLELLIEPIDTVPGSLVGDPLRLSQVLTNLCSNAIKFSSSGEIVISVSPLEQRDGRVTLRFSVRDKGIGMSAEQVGKLFKPFSQADSSTTRKYGGTGLGLAICRQLVTLMNGEISVTSEPGQGSEFFFSAVFGLGDANLQRIPESTPDLRGMRVLVVDDSPVACDIFRSQLSSLSYDVSVAFSGAEAVAKVEQSVGKTPFDLMIVDWIMPEMDGFETVRRIREIPGLSPLPRIILATAYGCAEAAQMARAGKLDGYLAKPSNLSGLFDVIMGAFGKDNLERGLGQREKGAGLSGLADIRGASVLLVEDNEYNQLVACELLKSAGLFTTVAENGKKALEVLAEKPFDLVLMDIQMPVMDGYEATRCIRTDPAYNSLPIVAMTAHAMATDRDKCLIAGMNDYVSKPIDPDDLFAVLVKWIKPGERLPGELEQPPPAVPGGDVEVYLPHVLPGIFVGAGLRMCNDNKRLYRDLLIRFRRDRRGTAADIIEALGSGDRQLAVRIAHTMKSVAGTLGANNLSESAVLLERAINSADGVAVERRLAEFSRSLLLVVDGLDAAFPDLEQAGGQNAGFGLSPDTIDRERIRRLLVELSGLLKSDIGQAMKRVETLRELLPEGPAVELYRRIERQMSEFDVDGVHESLDELARVLEMPEEVS